MPKNGGEQVSIELKSEIKLDDYDSEFLTTTHQELIKLEENIQKYASQIEELNTTLQRHIGAKESLVHMLKRLTVTIGEKYEVGDEKYQVVNVEGNWVLKNLEVQ